MVNHKLCPERALLFRIVHVQNTPWILERGLHCRNSDCVDPHFVNIGNTDLIGRRNARAVPVDPGGSLSDYVPFYFTPYSIMLFNIITGCNVPKQPKRDIVILVSSLYRLQELGIPFVFTDCHAYPVSARYFNDIHDLDKVDWALLQSRDFQNNPDDPGKKERYQAEALAHRHVPVNALLGAVCYTDSVRNRLQDTCKSKELNIRLEVCPGWYF